MGLARGQWLPCARAKLAQGPHPRAGVGGPGWEAAREWVHPPRHAAADPLASFIYPVEIKPIGEIPGGTGLEKGPSCWQRDAGGCGWSASRHCNTAGVFPGRSKTSFSVSPSEHTRTGVTTGWGVAWKVTLSPLARAYPSPSLPQFPSSRAALPEISLLPPALGGPVVCLLSRQAAVGHLCPHSWGRRWRGATRCPMAGRSGRHERPVP